MIYKNNDQDLGAKSIRSFILLLAAFDHVLFLSRAFFYLLFITAACFSKNVWATCDSGLICTEPEVSEYVYQSFPKCYTAPCKSEGDVISEFMNSLGQNYCALRYESTSWVDSRDKVFRQYVALATKSVTFYGQLIVNGVCTAPETKNNTYGFTRSRTINCPQGFAPWHQISDGSTTCAMSIASNKPQPNKVLGNACDGVRNPISIGLGNKFEIEKDIQLEAFKDIQLEFVRYYNSKKTAVELNTPSAFYAPLGSQWEHNLNYRIRLSSSSTGTSVFVQRGTGRIITFNLQGSIYQSDADVKDQLLALTDISGLQIGWKYITTTGNVETYNLNGNVTSVSARSGYTLTFQYSNQSTPITTAPGPDLLISISDPLGRVIKLAYDSQGRVNRVTDPSGGVFLYTYDGSSGPAKGNNLTSITYPNGQTKIYHYENTNNKHALTGITDENNSRFSIYGYDNNGRANSTEHAGTVEKSTIIYNVNTNGSPTSAVVTDPGTGAVRTFSYTTILGVPKIVGQSQPAGSGCAASASSLGYDANGNVASRIDFNGNKTTYVYDLTRNVETSRTEGLTTAGAATTATRTTTTSWHATWRLPLVVSVYTGATASGTPVQRTTYTYDTKGNITSVLEEDPVRSLSRTTTTTYTYSSAVPGLILQKVVNGPRTDVTDTTTYEYYPHDATCTASTATPIVDPITGVAPANYGCRGQLKQVTNALGHITTYDRYNHHGQLEQMTDANGLVTQQTYDLRQRLLTRTVSGSGITTQTTQLTYDNVGQITQLKMPDNSTLNYTYDAAHRLTDIEDTLGNKVHYTLDTEGNRTQEDVYDPNNALSTTLTRSFDALNRLQTQTGM